MNNNKIKLFLFFILFLILVIIFFYSIFGTSLSYLDTNEIIKGREKKENLISELKINNIDTIYDKTNNIYYYNLSERYENNNYVLKLDLNNGYKYKIINQNFNIIKVDYNKTIDIIIFNDKYYYETKVQLTNVPIINITSEKKITTNDSKSTFTYINAENSEKKITVNSEIHVRGATTASLNKKSYKINFYNDNYTNEKNLYISNFYYGHAMILDAVYRDPSKIRNVLATNLWNDISNDFTELNMSSEFVELFINNEYMGLYVFTEPVNRRKLNLLKSNSDDTSIIVKSQGWTHIDDILKSYNIDSDYFMEYELKYPNNDDLFTESWDKILIKLAKYYNNSNSYSIINETWNIKNYIDMIIFNSFINNSDNNMLKNNYFYMNSLNDEEVYIQPWDMEYSFGLRYSKTSPGFEKNVEDYNKIYTMFIHEDDYQINKKLIDRYWNLRENILTEKYFDNLLDSYKEKLMKGAASRDSNKWKSYDIEKEIEDVRNWIYNRIKFFDSYVEGLDYE